MTRRAKSTPTETVEAAERSGIGARGESPEREPAARDHQRRARVREAGVEGRAAARHEPRGSRDDRRHRSARRSPDSPSSRWCILTTAGVFSMSHRSAYSGVPASVRVSNFRPRRRGTLGRVAFRSLRHLHWRARGLERDERRHGAEGSRGAAASVTENGSSRTAGRRHRARLQQPAHGNRRIHGNRAGRTAGRRTDGRAASRSSPRRRFGGLADAAAAHVQPQTDRAAQPARSQCGRRRCRAASETHAGRRHRDRDEPAFRPASDSGQTRLSCSRC